MNISKIIIKHQTARGWSNAQLAQKSGISTSALSDILRDKVKPDVDTLEKISESFNMSLSFLFSEAGEELELTDTQKRLLALWRGMPNERQEKLYKYVEIAGQRKRGRVSAPSDQPET